MSRKVFDQSKVHPSVHHEIGGKQEHRQVVEEVSDAIHKHAVVIVGMKHNPHPKRARKILDDLGVAYHYLEYGSYTSEWKLRGALKMWTGWQTFPMIFVKGQFIGGRQDLEKLIQSGEFNTLLAS
jgi:glutaredoxin-related protein